MPFCRVRCGYCDFNTYTARDLGGGAAQSEFADTLIREIKLAAAEQPPNGRATSVFFGGGTPTILPTADLARMLAAIRDVWPLAETAEITTEANPDSVTRQSLVELAAAGFTRVSLGMQSHQAQVLRTLERTHDPERVPEAVAWAREAGLAVSLDLIYGTPGESLADWRASVAAALATGVDHLSAYALTVEPHTRMGARIRRGELTAPDEDDAATKYEVLDDLARDAGMEWYEISNWARGGIGGPYPCRHNLNYWRSGDWLGVGPGAHSHLRGTRWWNVKHPRAYAARVRAGELPITGREALSDRQRVLERLMLEIRLAEGLDLATLGEPSNPPPPSGALQPSNPPPPSGARQPSNPPPPSGALQSVVAELVATGLLAPAPAHQGRAVLTRRGRLLADVVIRRLAIALEIT